MKVGRFVSHLKLANHRGRWECGKLCYVARAHASCTDLRPCWNSTSCLIGEPPDWKLNSGLLGNYNTYVHVRSTNPCILHEIHHGNIFMSGLETISVGCCGSGIGSARVGGNVSELGDLKISKYQLLGRFSRPLCQLKMRICHSVGNLINNLLTPCCGWLGRIALSKMKMWGGQPFLFVWSFRFHAVL